VTVAVTGPLASGKSAFARMLGELGAETVSSDGIVHDLLANDPETVERVVERFGEEVRGERGVDRHALGRLVFESPEALRGLEEILHPLVRRETERRIEESEAEMFVAEVPLLFEAGREGDFDYTVAVVTPEERRQAWFAERGLDGARLRAIEERQLPGKEKARRADLVVCNDGGLDRLREQAREVRDAVLGKRSSNEQEA
jgi:dephospho-CoA kinase